MQPKKKIVLIGAGNIAHFLAPRIHGDLFDIIQVFGRSKSNTQQLAQKINTAYTCNVKEMATEANIYIIAVPDNAITEICKNINAYNAIIAHTSGSTPLDVLQYCSKNYGVLYPFQTFSKNITPQHTNFPIFIEANNDNTFTQLHEIATLLSEQIYPLDSNQRMMLHIAAVFACNFANTMYSIAADMCKKNDIDFNWLKPLIAETANKINATEPEIAQTGPAVRKDYATIEKHMHILKQNPQWLEFYKSISDYILKKNN